MLISEFARVTGLTRDTVRFYARLGLLQPPTNVKGNGELTCERGIEVMSAQLVRLEAEATELETMISYVRAKIDWMTRGKQGRQPDFGSYVS